MIKISNKIISAFLTLCILCAVFSVSTFAASGKAVGSGDYYADAANLSFGYAHSAYITGNGDLYAWGENDVGRIGDGTTESKYTPTKIMSNVKTVSLGNGHSGAITENGDLYMWAYNKYGQLGDGTTDNSIIPKR